jgi:hypothetical protein
LRAAVSLHSHSSCSREKLEFMPGFVRQLPVVARRFERALAAYERKHGRPLDFTSICWRPPLAPANVIVSEREQAARRFDLDAFVSLTDHDTIEGPKALRAAGQSDVPLSFEWSVPAEGSTFHVGVHGLPPSRVDPIERALSAYTTQQLGSLAELFEMLAECPETVIILNHPCWDLRKIGQLRHDASLLAFLRRYRDWIHGLELNGYRTWTENRRVLPLSEGFGIPLVGGGDRHGYAANSIVNLTQASSFEEFAHELRDDRFSHCVVFPEYTEAFAARVLEAACDILKPDPRSEWNGGGWENCVFVTVDGVERPVHTTWDGTPAWIGASVAAVRLLGSTVGRAAFDLTRADGRRTLESDCQPGMVAAGSRTAPQTSEAA